MREAAIRALILDTTILKFEKSVLLSEHSPILQVKTKNFRFFRVNIWYQYHRSSLFLRFDDITDFILLDYFISDKIFTCNRA